MARNERSSVMPRNIKAPKVPVDVYPREKNGSYGELGGGGIVKAQYLLTTFLPEDLEHIKLISEIDGSEKWDVRDLFQREIDTARVEHSIMPYLEDQSKVKFFNPITLTLLPKQRNTNKILKDLPILNKSETDEDYIEYEHENVYQLREYREEPRFSCLRWNDLRVNMVAIDGQHRLSALKMMAAGGSSTLENWSIPVVIIILSKVAGGGQTPSILDVVRNIFIYINTEARGVVKARQILLNNESVTAICTQELLRRSHSNDIIEDTAQKNFRIMPLTFFDWRGVEEWKAKRKKFVRIKSPSHVKSIEEVHDWFVAYIVGEDYKDIDNQQRVLGLKEMDPPISLRPDDKLSESDAERIRDQFANTVMQGVCYLFENFIPYKNYIDEYRKVEKEYTGQSPPSIIKEYAFQALLYGISTEPKDLANDVKSEYVDLKGKLHKIVKNKIGLTDLLENDIGMRGVFCAFSRTKKVYDDVTKKTSPWLDYSKWFVASLNKIYKDGWLDDEDNKDTKKHLLHITHDPRSKRKNYRLDDVKKALGILIKILILKNGNSAIELNRGDYNKQVKKEWVDIRDELDTTIKKGYRTELKPQAIQRFPDSENKQKEYLKKESVKRAEKHLDALEIDIGL